MLTFSGELNPLKGLYLLQTQPIAPLYSPYSAPPSIWAQLLTLLVIGLLTALAFQLLLTVLGIALGVSVLQVGSSEGDSEGDRSTSNSSTIGILAGLGVLLTVNTVLFAACFLATKFGQVSDPISGAIAGIVIWSAYFLLMLWLSSTAVNSLVGVVLSTLTGSFRQIVSAIANAFSSDKPEPITEEQMLTSIREEMQSALSAVNLGQMIEEQLQTLPLPIYQPDVSPNGSKSLNGAKSLNVSKNDLTHTELWQQVTAYLQDTSSKSLTPKRVDRKLQKILHSDVNELSSGFTLDRAALVQVLNQREDLSDKRKQRIINQLEQTWHQFLEELPVAETVDFTTNLETNGSKPAVSEDEVGETGRSPATAKLLQSALDSTVEQVLTHLPKLIQRSDTSLLKGSELVPVVLSIALAKIRDSLSNGAASDNIASDNAAKANAASNNAVGSNAAIKVLVDNLPSLKVPLDLPALDDVDFKQTLERLLTSSVSLPNLNPSIVTQASQLREKAMQPIEAIQQSAQERINAAKRRTQQQIESTRKAAAAAAWWLFLTAFTGAASAAVAGAWAAGFNPVKFFVLIRA
ncbi:MAG: hypothetical protein HC879_15955 [Leptolyngbyaceae cyanobacterium SL_5_9]|nr:hypothetical protein [Leptolyngbyaceae cyanobacterium SL_5_9]NJO76061.1 hypothetical protein [Leptolyngbyaceae cyanobacterium RM1_406_9]